MRSGVVVLPASMWARMPMFRVSFRDTCLAMTLLSFYLFYPVTPFRGALLKAAQLVRRRSIPFLPRSLPAVVSESLVRLGHAVRVFLLLHRAAATLRRVHQLAGQAGAHRLLAATLRRGDDPAHRQRQL